MENDKGSIIHEFHKKVHSWGRLTVGIAIICSLLIPAYLTFILGHYPNSSDVITGLISVAGFVGVIWFVEPVSYFPVLGPAGTYMSFLSGNIGNMRLPVIAATQDALGLEPGSEEAEVAGIYALIGSTLTNLAILGLVMVAGQVIMNTLPATILDAFQYALPGILGAMIVMNGSKIKKLSNLVALVVIALATLTFIRYSPNFLPATVAQLIGAADVGVIAILGIAYSLIRAKKDNVEEVV